MQISWQHVKREGRRRRRATAINAPEFTSQQSTVNSLTRRSLKAGNASLRTAHKRKTKAKAKCNEFVALQQEVAWQRAGKRERERSDGKLLTHTHQNTHTQVTGVVCIVAAFCLTCTCPLYRINHTSFSAMSMYVCICMCVFLCVFVAPVEDSPRQAEQQHTSMCVCVCECQLIRCKLRAERRSPPALNAIAVM